MASPTLRKCPQNQEVHNAFDYGHMNRVKMPVHSRERTSGFVNKEGGIYMDDVVRIVEIERNILSL